MPVPAFFPRPELALGITAAALTLPPILLLLLSALPHRKPQPVLPPLPNGIERVYVKAGDGVGLLEVLVARPNAVDEEVGVEDQGDQEAEKEEEDEKKDEGKNKEKNKKPLSPLLLIHGGYGSAFCWTHWIQYFRARGRPVFAVSLSGHGLSTRPAYFQLRPKGFFAKDVRAVLAYIKAHSDASPGLASDPATGCEALAPVLVGHSAGGGLAQYVVDVLSGEEGVKEVAGLVLVSPFPPQGGWRVYINWFQIDPLLSLRMLLRLGDPGTVLDTPGRVCRAFFGRAYCASLYGGEGARGLVKVESVPADDATTAKDTLPPGFLAQMTKEESVGWPSSMMFPFVDVERVKKGVGLSRLARASGKEVSPARGELRTSPAVEESSASHGSQESTALPAREDSVMRESSPLNSDSSSSSPSAGECSSSSPSVDSPSSFPSPSISQIVQPSTPTVPRIYLLAGTHDALMTPAVMRLAQGVYRCGLGFVQGAGHHMMQDAQWEEGARMVRKQLDEWGV